MLTRSSETKQRILVLAGFAGILGGVAMPSLAFVFPASGALFLVGWSLFAFQLKRVRAVDPQAALGLLISVVAFAAGLSGRLPFVAVKVGAAMFGAGLAWTGWSLMDQARSMS